MKIVVLHGQQHKRNTYKLTQEFMQELVSPSDEVKEFYVNDIPPCAGCFSCILQDEKKCPHRSITEPIITAIEEADILVAESPNYCMGMTGQLKILFDHLAYRWMSHRPHPSMRRKIGVAVSTAAGAGANKVTKAIADQMFWLGAAKTYQISINIFANSLDEMKQSKKNKLSNDIKRISGRIKKTAGKAKPGIKSKFLFMMMGKMQKGMGYNPVDTKYWKEQGWI
jgi:multimeric flavodoxin WrbA